MRRSKRDLILAQAVDLIAADGLAGLSFDSLATATGLSKSGIIYHFPSRHELLLGVHTHLAGLWERELEELTGISGALILNWANRADLFRIKGVGEEYSDLLEAAGVDTVPELAQRNPDNLYRALVETNAAKELVRHLPGREQVADWVAQAKELPRVLTY